MADAKTGEEANPVLNGNETCDSSSRNIYTADERSEYFLKLEKWLQQAHALQGVAATLPYHILSGQIFNQSGLHPFITPILTTENSSPASDGASPLAGTPEWQNIEPVRQRTPQEPRVPFQPPRVEGYEYRIPPVWKRFVADFIDATIVLMLVIAFFTFDLFAAIGLESYLFDFLQSILRNDYKTAVDLASRVLILEMMHRSIICVYEVFWLQHGMNGTIGGASPGKLAMGLIVVQCRNIAPIERPDSNDMVFVSPGTDLGLPLALARSIVKGLVMTFLFPVCFAPFVFRFNRTGYDLACNSIVVEVPLRNNANNRFRGQ